MNESPALLTNIRDLISCVGCQTKLFPIPPSNTAQHSLSSALALSIACHNQRCEICCHKTISPCKLHKNPNKNNFADNENFDFSSLDARVDGVFENGLLISAITKENYLLKGILLFDESIIQIHPLINENDNNNNDSEELSLSSIIPLYPNNNINKNYDLLGQLNRINNKTSTSTPQSSSLTQSQSQSLSSPLSSSMNYSDDVSDSGRKRRYNKTGKHSKKRKEGFDELFFSNKKPNEEANSSNNNNQNNSQPILTLTSQSQSESISSLQSASLEEQSQQQQHSTQQANEENNNNIDNTDDNAAAGGELTAAMSF